MVACTGTTGKITIDSGATLNIENAPFGPLLGIIVNAGVINNYGIIDIQTGTEVETGIFNVGSSGIFYNYGTIDVSNVIGNGIRNNFVFDNEATGVIRLSSAPGAIALSGSITNDGTICGSTFDGYINLKSDPILPACPVIPTPVFPLGSILAVLIPLAALATFFFTKRVRTIRFSAPGIQGSEAVLQH